MRNNSRGVPEFYNVPEYTPRLTDYELDYLLKNTNTTEFHLLRKKVTTNI